jgi:hypothetical protein
MVLCEARLARRVFTSCLVQPHSSTPGAAIAAILLGGCTTYHAAVPTNPSEASCRAEVESAVTDMYLGPPGQEWPAPVAHVRPVDSPYLDVYLPGDERTYHAVIVARAGLCYVAQRRRHSGHVKTFVLGDASTRPLPHCMCNPDRVTDSGWGVNMQWP